jgi:hypothetical protein
LTQAGYHQALVPFACRPGFWLASLTMFQNDDLGPEHLQQNNRKPCPAPASGRYDPASTGLPPREGARTCASAFRPTGLSSLDARLARGNTLI